MFLYCKKHWSVFEFIGIISCDSNSWIPLFHRPNGGTKWPKWKRDVYAVRCEKNYVSIFLVRFSPQFTSEKPTRTTNFPSHRKDGRVISSLRKLLYKLNKTTKKPAPIEWDYRSSSRRQFGWTTAHTKKNSAFQKLRNRLLPQEFPIYSMNKKKSDCYRKLCSFYFRNGLWLCVWYHGNIFVL